MFNSGVKYMNIWYYEWGYWYFRVKIDRFNVGENEIKF